MQVVGERVRLLRTGWDEALSYTDEEAPLPAPTGKNLVVEVEACGVCYRDLIDREGRFAFIRTPITPGHEAAGRVVAVGPEVRDFAVGDRVGSMHRDACGACPGCLRGETPLCEGAFAVLGLLVDGGYARHLVAPESAFFSIPDDLAPAEAAVMHCTFGTALRALSSLGKLGAGERVLITGANGGVGMAAIQIAARLGAEVVAVIRDARHRAFVESLGAAIVVVDPGDGFHKSAVAGTVQLALDTVGPPTFNSTLRSLRSGGRLVVVGNVVEAKVSLNLGYIITRGIPIIGAGGASRGEMARLFALHAEKPFHAAIERVMPLAQADEAQRLVKAGGRQGRIVLVPRAG